MCLLDSVLRWDMTNISCTTSSHRDHQNPLRGPQGLETVCGLEYAAQAIGVHIGLTSSLTNKGGAIGYVGSIKNLKIHSPHLDPFKDDLEIHAELLLGQETGFIYSFTIKAKLVVIFEGRASIFVKNIEE
jgi:predicted hotdog family 3-hydroxylacyl-ACP dehydratase